MRTKKPLSNSVAAHRHRLLIAAAILELYRRDVGDQPRSLEALRAWVVSNPNLPKPIDPYSVLTTDQIADFYWQRGWR